jgi:hypothetical protein
LRWWRGYTIGLLALAAGCGPGGDRRRIELEAADPADRVRAIIAAVEDDGADPRWAVAALVDRLDDEDKAVRFYAIAGLDRLTGQRLGYRSYDPAGRRRLAIERWRAYLCGLDVAEGPPPS